MFSTAQLQRHRPRTSGKTNKSNAAAAEQMNESGVPDTIVLFTQNKKRLSGSGSGTDTIVKVANGFFKNKEISHRLIKPPIAREERECLSERENFNDGLNLLLIGHGSGGRISIGAIQKLDLNELELPQSLTSKVEHIYLLHCTAGRNLKKIAETTLLQKDRWSSLKTISGNMFYNNWQSMGDVIQRKGWADPSAKPTWRGQAEKKLAKENESKKSLDDFQLKNTIAYNVKSILSTEGYHRTYNVSEAKAKFSYK